QGFVISAVFRVGPEHAGLIFHQHNGIFRYDNAIAELQLWMVQWPRVRNEYRICAGTCIPHQLVHIFLEYSAPKLTQLQTMDRIGVPVGASLDFLKKKQIVHHYESAPSCYQM